MKRMLKQRISSQIAEDVTSDDVQCLYDVHSDDVQCLGSPDGNRNNYDGSRNNYDECTDAFSHLMGNGQQRSYAEDIGYSPQLMGNIHRPYPIYAGGNSTSYPIYDGGNGPPHLMGPAEQLHPSYAAGSGHFSYDVCSNQYDAGNSNYYESAGQVRYDNCSPNYPQPPIEPNSTYVYNPADSCDPVGYQQPSYPHDASATLSCNFDEKIKSSNPRKSIKKKKTFTYYADGKEVTLPDDFSIHGENDDGYIEEDGAVDLSEQKSNKKKDSPRGSDGRTLPTCVKCFIHFPDQKIRVKGHICPLKNCVCVDCKKHDQDNVGNSTLRMQTYYRNKNYDGI